MSMTPHMDKLLSAINNPKCKNDIDVLNEALNNYNAWVKKLDNVKTKGEQKVKDLVDLLNEYKDLLEVELIMGKGSPFLKRQKGQLKLDNSVLEEFLIRLVDKDILTNLPNFELEKGPKTSFMSLSFRPSGVNSLNDKPDIVLKEKDQDFTIGKSIFYKFSADDKFSIQKTTEGSLYLSALAAEVKVNYDKTMFQECSGTAYRLKQGCPISRYYVLVEYLDMQPEDCRLTDIDNVFLLRRAKRLPFEKRNDYNIVKAQHKEFPIDHNVVYKFVQEIQNFIDSVWYDPNAAFERGSFI